MDWDLGFLPPERGKSHKQCSSNEHLETARARQLIIERYGVAFARQEPVTLKWWIVAESGEILCSGDTENEAWIHSAFMPIDEQRSSISVKS